MIKNIIKNFWPFIKYCIVGATGTFVDLAFLYIFVEYAALPVLTATTISFVLAVINNFILNKIWTFQNKSKNYRKLFIKFLIVSVIGLGLTLGCMYILVHILIVWYMLAKLITSIIVLTWNFFGNKIWTFRLREKIVEVPENFIFEYSIVIPAYNESNRIKNTLLLIDNYIKEANLNAEIIAVDDGSKDNTVQIIKTLASKIPNLKLETYSKNHGKGFAVKTGVFASKGKYILFADADNSTPIQELESLKEAMDKNSAQIAIGSRYLNESKVQIKQPGYRILIGRLGNLLIRLFLIDDIKDTQCGFKLFEHRVAKEIFSFQKVKRFGFDMEALVVAKSLGYKIVEVPVNWFNSVESRLRPVRDSLTTLKDLIYIKINLWSGRYFQE